MVVGVAEQIDEPENAQDDRETEAQGARHEPDSFSAASTGVWLMGALTTALLVRAVMALAAPLIGLAGAVLGQALQVMQNGAEP